MADEKPQDGTNQDQESTNPGTSLDDNPGTQDLSAEKVADLLEQKRRANREAKQAKEQFRATEKQLAEMQAKIEEYELKDKSEIEKAQAQAEKAKSDLARLNAELALTRRINIAVTAGAKDEKCAKFLAGELEEAQNKNSDLDAAEFLAQMKEEHPAFFKGNGGAPASAQGGPTTGGKGNDKMMQLDKIKEELKSLLVNRGSDRVELRIQELSNQAAKLEQELKG